MPHSPMGIETILREKSTAFAVNVAKIYDNIRVTKGEPVISKHFATAAAAATTKVRQALGTPNHRGDIQKLETVKDNLAKTVRWAENLYKIDCIELAELENVTKEAIGIVRLIAEIEEEAGESVVDK